MREGRRVREAVGVVVGREGVGRKVKRFLEAEGW